MGSTSRVHSKVTQGYEGTDSASRTRSVGTDSATIKIKVCFTINYVSIPATTTHDF